jgi:hypothetical protein
MNVVNSFQKMQQVSDVFECIHRKHACKECFSEAENFCMPGKIYQVIDMASFLLIDHV